MKKITVVLLLLFLSCQVFCAAPRNVRSIKNKPRDTGEVLVTYKKAVSSKDISDFNAKHNSSLNLLSDMISEVENGYGLKRTRVDKTSKALTCYRAPDPAAIDSLVNSLNAESIVEKAQPNYILRALDAYSYVYSAAPGGPNDAVYNYENSHGPIINGPCYGSPYEGQWYINQIYADQAFAEGLTTAPPGRDIIVAVIDTGVNYAGGNPDLAGVVLPGYNEITPTAQPYDDDLADQCGDAGHGTHVAGIIAANTNNSTGIASASMSRGVTWTSNVKILPVKVLDMDGNGNDYDIFNGIEWAADNGADIINMSFGGSDPDAVLEQAVNYAYSNGVLCVAAAGNDSSQTYYPAVYPNVMAVSASDIAIDSCGGTCDVLASFSNYGKIDIAAPGVNIWSTANNNDTSNSPGTIYSSMDGTSFASPIVAAAAALVKLKNPLLSPDNIRMILEQTADDDYQPCAGGNPGYDKYFGWGRVNVLRALKQDYNVPANEPAIRTYNWPNPFSPNNDGFTNIIFRISQQADVSIKIYDGGGRLVWKTDVPAAQVSTAAYNTVKWNGKNTSGAGVANGVYFYLVKSSAGPYAKNKIAVLY
jgi:subtilisin family serine protease